MQNLLQDLVQLLEKDDRLVVEGQLLKNKVIELALALDSGLLRLLLSHDGIRRHFFTDVDSLLVFDKIKFQQFVSNKAFLPDSYTAFKNKIGLTAEGSYLADSKEVVLAWPYKDCVLEGGQTKEDAKRNEIFWNETLAPDEIDRLLAPKVLTNFKKYDKSGKHTVTSFSRDANIIIKGNNLLALHTLKQAYARQVKLVYIDPPYNTESDSNTFAYNNSFNHSSWLTFMRNRLLVAKEFLRDDGLIAIAIDHYEMFYLGVLADEIFGRENRVGVLAIEVNPRGRTINKFFATSHENLLIYAKNAEAAEIKFMPLTKEQAEAFSSSDDTSEYRLLPFRRSGGLSTPDERPNSFYPIYYNESTGYIGIEKQDGCEEIFPIDSDGKQRVWRQTRPSLMDAVKRGDIIIKRSKGSFTVLMKDRIKAGRKPKTIWVNPLYDASSHGTNLLKDILGEKAFSYPKSIHLVKDVLRITIDDEDLVMDFFAGSGTTAHAVMELNKEDGGSRRFILCEQMQYIESVTIPRVHKVIQNNSAGSFIDSDSFIYCELAQANQAFVDQIQSSESSEDLQNIWQAMQEKAFLSYRINPKAIDLAGADFTALNLDDQKRFLIEVLDKNILYVPLSEIDDTTYAISDEDKKLNHQFSSQS